MGEYDAIPDEDLIVRYHDGESDVMDYLMVKYKPMVRKKARAMYLIGGENDDLIQEGMIGLMKAVRDYSPQKEMSFSGFAELCVSRQMYSAIKASKRQKHIPLNSYVSLYEQEKAGDDEKSIPLIDTLAPEEETDPEILYVGKAYSEAFLGELKGRLSSLENDVLNLHLEGMNYRDIAERLGKSPKVVDNALQRIRAKAEKLLKEHET